MSTHPKTKLDSMKKSIVFITLVIAMTLFIGISILRYEGAKEITATPTAGQIQRVVVRKARPQAEVFKVWAPVGRKSEQIPATPRHCLDWWPEPPYTRADVAVFVKGKPYKHSDAPEEGLIVSGFYAQYQSTLKVPVPLNLVRYPMKKRKC